MSSPFDKIPPPNPNINAGISPEAQAVIDRLLSSEPDASNINFVKGSEKRVNTIADIKDFLPGHEKTDIVRLVLNTLLEVMEDRYPSFFRDMDEDNKNRKIYQIFHDPTIIKLNENTDTLLKKDSELRDIIEKVLYKILGEPH